MKNQQFSLAGLVTSLAFYLLLVFAVLTIVQSFSTDRSTRVGRMMISEEWFNGLQ